MNYQHCPKSLDDKPPSTIVNLIGNLNEKEAKELFFWVCGLYGAEVQNEIIELINKRRKELK